jgi:hypothetical protein
MREAFTASAVIHARDLSLFYWPHHLLLDSCDGEWEAQVDGQPAEVPRANGLFRAVRVASGEPQVRWVYRPRTLWAGAALAGRQR